MTDNDILRGDFDQFDADKNGYIDSEEFANLLDFLDVKFTSADGVKTAFAAIDKDGSGKIEFEEFRTWWLAYQDES